jgi:uncharacterized protein (TIGR00251 family)
MKINIKVVPNSKVPKIKQEINGLKVYVNAPPEDGKANEAVIKALADYFKIKTSQINVLSGHTGRNKIIEIIS